MKKKKKNLFRFINLSSFSKVEANCNVLEFSHKYVFAIDIITNS